MEHHQVDRPFMWRRLNLNAVTPASAAWQSAEKNAKPMTKPELLSRLSVRGIQISRQTKNLNHSIQFTIWNRFVGFSSIMPRPQPQGVCLCFPKRPSEWTRAFQSRMKAIDCSAQHDRLGIMLGHRNKFLFSPILYASCSSFNILSSFYSQFIINSKRK